MLRVSFLGVGREGFGLGGFFGLRFFGWDLWPGGVRIPHQASLSGDAVRAKLVTSGLTSGKISD